MKSHSANWARAFKAESRLNKQQTFRGFALSFLGPRLLAGEPQDVPLGDLRCTGQWREIVVVQGGRFLEECSFGRCVGRQRNSVWRTAGATRAAREETNTTLEFSVSKGSSCCTRKKGARTLVANRLSKSSMVCSSMGAALPMPALATRMSSFSPAIPLTCLARVAGPSGAARSADTISASPPGVTAGGVDLFAQAFRFGRAATVVDDDTRAPIGQSDCGGAADSARCAGDKGKFCVKITHIFFRVIGFRPIQLFC